MTNKQKDDVLNNLKLYAKDWKILIDTCSLLESEINQFFTNISKFLYDYQNKIIIPAGCYKELEKFKNEKFESDLEKVERAVKADKVLSYISQFKDQFIIYGENNVGFADNELQVIITKFRMKYKMLLITQDNNLAKDVMKLNNSSSVKANTVRVRRLNKYGFLSEFSWIKKEIDLFIEKNFDEYILRICEDAVFYKKNFYNKYSLPISKIKHNINKFKIDNINYKDIIGILDLTYFNSLNRGIIFTHKGMFVKGNRDKPLHIYYDRITELKFKDKILYITQYHYDTQTKKKFFTTISMTNGSTFSSNNYWWIHCEYIYEYLLSIYNYLNK